MFALPGLSATLVKRSEEDAGKSQFGSRTHGAFVTLRLQLGEWLDAQAPAPRDRWHEIRPMRPDLARAPQIKPLPAPVKP